MNKIKSVNKYPLKDYRVLIPLEKGIPIVREDVYLKEKVTTTSKSLRNRVITKDSLGKLYKGDNSVVCKWSTIGIDLEDINLNSIISVNDLNDAIVYVPYPCDLIVTQNPNYDFIILNIKCKEKEDGTIVGRDYKVEAMDNINTETLNNIKLVFNIVIKGFLAHTGRVSKRKLLNLI